MNMIKQEQIVKNTKKYFQTAQEHGFMTEELMSFLGENFIKAPASTMSDLHNAFEGGLIDHLLRVTKYAVSINETILPENLKLQKKDIIKVCFLHQIGKAHLYTPCTSEWHIKNQGKMYDFNDDLTSMRVGERSAHYVLTNGVTLTEEEYQAIINFDKDDSDKQAKYHNSLLGDLLKMANQLAITEEKNQKN
jgi:hypothetical protein